MSEKAGDLWFRGLGFGCSLLGSRAVFFFFFFGGGGGGGLRASASKFSELGFGF